MLRRLARFLGPARETAPARWLRRRLATESVPADVFAVVDALSGAGVRAWLVGGWGVDALLGRQTRSHMDVDVAVDASGEDADVAALAALAAIGYHPHDDGIPGGVWMPRRWNLRRADGRGVELLAVGEREQRAYPPGWLASGVIDGRTVPCASAALQLRLHQGYRPRAEDRVDVRALAALGDLPLPPGYTSASRQPGLTATAVRRNWRRARRRLLGERRPAESILVVAVPAVVSALEGVPGFADPEPATGVPVHVTVLYPFVPAAAIDDATLDAVAQVLAGIEPFAFTLGRLGHFPAVTYLAPEPAWAFLDITQRVWARWPSHPPYAGDFAADVPHVSVTGDEAEIERRLPIETEATEVLLLVEGEGRWVERARFRLGPNGVTPGH